MAHIGYEIGGASPSSCETNKELNYSGYGLGSGIQSGGLSGYLQAVPSPPDYRKAIQAEIEFHRRTIQVLEKLLNPSV